MSYVEIRTGKQKIGSAFTGPPCPVCGKPTLPGSSYCYKCDHFLDQGLTRALRCGEVSEQEIQALLRRSEESRLAYDNHPGTIQSRKMLLVTIAGMAVGGLLVVLGLRFLGVALMLGAIAASVIVTRKVAPETPPDIVEGAHFAGLVSHYVTPYVLSSSFDRVEIYDPRGHVTSDFVDSTGLICKSYNVISGSQYIRAVYHGVPVELCNLHLQYKTVDEDNRANYTEAFEGLWMILDLGTRVSAPIYVVERRMGLRAKRPITTDYEAFNQRFLVACDDEAEAFRFLTPQVMEQILRMDDQAGGKTALLVMTDGRVCAAIDNNRRLFRTADPTEPLPKIREQQENELQYPLALIDTLNSAHLNR